MNLRIKGARRGGAVALACGLFLPACTGGSGTTTTAAETDTDDTGITSMTASASDSAGTGSTGTTSDSVGSDSMGSTGEPDELNCKFIDFVFVVDNSKSMANEQENLVEAVPGFVDAMQTAFPTVKNIRVGVVDTDTYPAIGTADEPLNGCPDGVDCNTCDYTLGAFIDKPNSNVDPNTSCNFSTDASYMDGDSPAFADEFECAALVGTDGNPVEQQIGALTEAISPDMNAAGACNEGFLRDDALLVFLAITDEEDDKDLPPAPQGGSLGDPDRWHDAILDAKNGKANNAVALALIGGSPKFADCPDLGGNNQGAEETPRIQEFVESFNINFVGNVCAAGYDTFFNEALEKVAEGCMKFIP